MIRRMPTGEGRPKIDFLREDLKVTIDFEREAFGSLPKVQPGDETTGRERFGILLGTISQRGKDHAHLSVKAILEEDPERQGDQDSMYTERESGVDYSIKAIKRDVDRYTRTIPAVRGLSLLGDTHTHPNSRSTQWSEGDLRSVAEGYGSRDLNPNEPYICGIGAMRNGKMEYEFYRLVRTAQGTYDFKVLDW